MLDLGVLPLAILVVRGVESPAVYCIPEPLQRRSQNKKKKEKDCSDKAVLGTDAYPIYILGSLKK